MEDQEISTEAEATEEVEKQFDIIEFFGLSKDKYDEAQVSSKIQEKLGISLLEMKEVLSKSVRDRAEEMTLELTNIAPFGNYDKMIEDNDGMADFLKTEAHKVENWNLYGIEVSPMNKELLSFIFKNPSIDDGEVFEGFVFVSKSSSRTMKKLLLILFLGVIACKDSSTTAMVNEIKYIRDPRTNLCYACFDLGYDDGSITNVPCTPEVMTLTQDLVVVDRSKATR